MNEGLEKLNHAPSETAQARFLDCCGSRRWAREMTAARPFAEAGALFAQAGQIWQSLDARDWLEAFAAHPKIGSRQSAPKQQIQSAEWSRGEQASVETAESSVLNDLAEANRLYEAKFGYIFIVCATGKSAAEMLELCRRRLENKPDAEIRIAADEQQKITEIRLQKLLESEN
jgi:2-oxo-4-hydroxy-4-carboxy-5-ureidoimidazoline decarboxylase